MFPAADAPYVCCAEFYGSINEPVDYDQRLYTILKQLYGAFHMRDVYLVYENGLVNITNNDTLYYYVRFNLTRLRQYRYIFRNYTVNVRDYVRMENPGLE